MLRPNADPQRSKFLMQFGLFLACVFCSYNSLSLAQERSSSISSITLKELLKKDFDLNVDIAGGWGQSREDPIVVLSSSEGDAAKNEVEVLRGLGFGRKIFWKSDKITVLAMPSGPIIQRKIETKEVQPTKVITQTENYYFRRASLPPAQGLLKSGYVVRIDEDVGIEFPYEISWLHFDEIVDYEQRAPGLGYSLAYSAPGIEATVFVYPSSWTSSGPTSYLDELAKARSEIILVYGENAIEHDWEVQDRQDHALYYFIPSREAPTLSLLLVGVRKGHFVKVRCTFTDEPLLRDVANDFVSDLLVLIRD